MGSSIFSSFSHGQTTVTTAGTKVQLTTSTAETGAVAVRGLTGNTGVVYVGGTGVSASTGYQLDKGESIVIPVSSPSLIWVDAATNGDKVCWMTVAP